MLVTSAAMPFVACWQRAGGELRARRLVIDRPGPMPERPAAVLVDRDGTLLRDVPYNGDPVRVEPLPGVRTGLDRLRDAGVPVALVSNQSGIARGLLDAADVDAVNRRVQELLGPFDAVLVCPHGPGDGCGCRKPAPGLLLEAARRLAVAPGRCAMIGDIGADIEAAAGAGARPLLVPTPVTRAEEVDAAPEVVPTFCAAVELLLAGGPPAPDVARAVGGVEAVA
jgi:HAD superfamily hydrolase (TIGR01662 family)